MGDQHGGHAALWRAMAASRSITVRWVVTSSPVWARRRSAAPARRRSPWRSSRAGTSPRQLARIGRQPPLGIGDQHRAQQIHGLRAWHRLAAFAAMRAQHVGDLRDRCCGSGSARRADSGRSSKSPRRRSRRNSPGPARVMSRPSNNTRPPVMRAARSSSRIAASAVTDLPEPLSPTRPSVSPRSTSKAHARQRLHAAVPRGEADRQILDAQQAHTRIRGSRMSRSPSPSRLKHRTASNQRKPGRKPPSTTCRW